ncbi:hypothetical protein AB0I81_54775 [Nonomuraea sp. NPDC050404]|uniref:hypothetical protein n=1 Tax=Nonomuraea sp. NPDC050404 TaxID=3155783 RepID=UPI0033D1BF41
MSAGGDGRGLESVVGRGERLTTGLGGENSEPVAGPDTALVAAVALLERSIDYALGSLRIVTPAALCRATPCADWNLLRLLEHMNDSLQTLNEAATTNHIPTPQTRPPQPPTQPSSQFRNPAQAPSHELNPAQDLWHINPAHDPTGDRTPAQACSRDGDPAQSRSRDGHPAQGRSRDGDPAQSHSRNRTSGAQNPFPDGNFVQHSATNCGSSQHPSRGCNPALPLRDSALEVLGRWTALLTHADHAPMTDRHLTRPMVAAVGAIEIVVHAWDVARSCGERHPIPPLLAEELFDLALLFVTREDRPARFAAPVIVPAGAPAQDHLLAYLGRRPDWFAHI